MSAPGCTTLGIWIEQILLIRERVIVEDVMVSLVICTYNPKEEFLERAISSILQQNCKRHEFEFFIVDNNSLHPVSELAVVRKNGIKVVKEPRQGLTAARECAVKHARGNILVFVDDDNILQEDYIMNTKALFSNKSIGVLSGHVTPEYEIAPKKWFYRFESTLAIRKLNTDRLYLTSVPTYTYYFPVGAGICVRKQILRDYFNSLGDKNRIEGRSGGSLSSGEDIDIGFFAIGAGYLIGACGKLRLAHAIPTARISVQYLQRLGKSSIRSSYLINKKWKNYFGGNVFDDFEKTKGMILRKMVLYIFLYPIMRFRVGFVYYKTLLQLSFLKDQR